MISRLNGKQQILRSLPGIQQGNWAEKGQLRSARLASAVVGIGPVARCVI